MSESSDVPKTADGSPITSPVKQLPGEGVLRKGDPKRSTYIEPGDIVLVSNQGREFHVWSYFLKAHSTYFRDHLTGDHKPIHIDATTTVLKLFLDVIHNRPLPGLALWHHREALFKLADKYGCAGVTTRITYGFNSALHKSPWEIFVHASQRGNLSLAKSALKAMDNNDVTHPAPKVTRLTPELTAGVSLPYLLGLFNAALKVEAAQHGQQPEWKAIAKHFTPVKGQGVKA